MMSRSRVVLGSVLAIAVFHGVVAPRVSLGWPTTLNSDVPICTSPGDQIIPSVVSDGAGGAIIVWRTGTGVASTLTAQRVDATGAPLWAANGVPVIATSTTGSFVVVPDGAGGAIIGYNFNTATAGLSDMGAQRVDASGALPWGPSGVAVCTASNDQQSPAIVPDGAGGAILTWADKRASGSPFSQIDDIYAQRVDSGGNALWAPNGVLVCGATGYQSNPVGAPDGAGGIIVSWDDARSSVEDVYAQRLDASGTPIWTANGIAVAATPGADQPYGCMADGMGGAIVLSMRYPTAFPSIGDVYAQRLGASGNALWGAGGVAVCADPANQLGPTLASDGAGGAIFAWLDTRSGTNTEVFAQRVDAGGTPQWMANGVGIRSTTVPGNASFFVKIVADGFGGAIVTWTDNRSASGDLYGQRVSAAGSSLWAQDGVAICTAPNNQGSQSQIPDGVGGAILAWQDSRNGNLDIYAQRISQYGFVGGLTTDTFGYISGHVTAGCPVADSPLLGVTLDAFAVGSGDLLGTAATDTNGEYDFGLLRAGDYTVTIVTPLGYTIASDEVLTTVTDGDTSTADFSLECASTTGEPSASGFWKHQFGIATGGNGSPQVDAATLCAYLDMIEAHFNNNALNQVVVYDAPAVAECATKLEIGKALLNLGGSPARIDKARQQLLSLLLNVAAGNLGLATVISKDGATVSQGITYCDGLIDDPSGDHVLAAAIAEKINSGQKVSAGVIPLTTAQIAYSRGLALATFRVTENPGPGDRSFRFTLGRPGSVRLRVFDVSGRMVSHVVDQWMEAGVHTVSWGGVGAGRFGSGIYFARLEADGGARTLKVVRAAR
jgi:hypothetical protein